MGLTITSTITGFGPSDVAVQGCTCAICAAAATKDAASLKSLGNVSTAGSNTRSAEFLKQGQDEQGNIVYSGNRNIDAVLIGTKWTSANLTFSFPTSGSAYGNRYDFGQALRHVTFNEAQQTAAREAFAMVSSYTKLTFTELDPNATERPTLRLSSSSLEAVGSAMGYFPSTPNNLGGDIWFGRTQQPYYENPERGNWGYITVLHEIGHTLGLKHGHSDYTQDDLGSYFDTNEPFYGTRALQYTKDGQQWSIMSYTTAPNTIVAFNGDEKNQAQTYMMYDIAALQYLYGANYTTNAGDSVYSWNPATGAMSLNGTVQYTPTGNKILSTVWDGGGNDTYDFGAYTSDLSIDLRPGEMTVLPVAQRANALAYVDGVSPMAGNIGNALLFEGNEASLIENAVGGSGNDRLIGNQADNRLEGGAGNDILAGGLGTDVLDGGTGNDIADFSDARSGITVSFNNDGADILVSHDGELDVLRHIEGAVGGAGDDVLNGDRNGNFLSGGRGGHDVLNGGAGKDTLIGASDTIEQVDQPDIVKDIDWYNHTMDTAVDLDGAFDLVANSLVTDSMTLPHATVRGTGPAGAVDYYRFTAEAGARAIIDLDGVAAGYQAIDIVDAQGRTIASNYGVEQTDAGSREGDAPFLEFTVQTSGLYYVRVGGVAVDWSGSPTTAALYYDTAYVLNVSVESARVTSIVTAVGSAVMNGGSGDDLIVAATGNDEIAGGNGTDTLSYVNARSRVSVDLAIKGAQDTGGSGRDTITGIQNLIGSRFSDTLKGDANDNVINGGGGNDRLVGGDGRDRISFEGTTQDVTFSLGRQSTAQTVRAGAIVVASGFEDVQGGSGNDRLAGDAAANSLWGGEGDDILVGSEDGTVGGVDTLNGGRGFDTASFASSTKSIFATLSSTNGKLARTDDGTVLAHFVSIEALEGGSGADTLQGNGEDNRLTGNDGDDMLSGGSGDDVLEGGWGDDLLRGSDGNDTAVYSGWGAHSVDLAIATAQETGLGKDVLSGIENLRGGQGEDYFFGSARNNIFFDVGGDDLYVGRGGVDTVDYSTATTLLTVDLSQMGQQDTRAAGYDLLDGIENIVGGDGGNILTGDAKANRLVGGVDRDVLIGGTGADRLEGGNGGDLLIGDLAGRSGEVVSNRQDDVLIGGAGGDQLIGGEGADLLQGGTGNDLLIGGAAVIDQYGDRFVVSGLILMDGGQDTLDGGDGDDYGILFYSGRKEAITIDNRDTAATNQVLFDGIGHGSITSIETLRFYGGDADDRVQTGSGYDLLQGGAGNDWLSSGQGDDLLSGGEGNDWLDGGEGMDSVSYAGASGDVTLDLRRIDAQDTGGAGVDTVRNLENVQTGRFSDRITGNDGSNTIRDSMDGNDTFLGLGGSDSLGVFRKYGDPAATIYLDGGEGSDVVEYYSSPTYDRFTPIFFYRQTDDVTLIGGSGRDGIYISGQKNGIIDAGEGDDDVTIGIGGLNESTLDITLGSGGKDRIIIAYTDNYIGEIDRFGNVVRDFDTGAGGDRMDLTNVLRGWDTNINPFSIRLMKLVQSGNDVQLQIDADGSGTYFQWRTMITFLSTEVEEFTADNFYHVIGDGYFEPFVEKPWDPQGANSVDTSAQQAAWVGDQSAAGSTFNFDPLLAPTLLQDAYTDPWMF